ncbi:uncharacterized protein METZ01_LOCUS456543 [marine metagenome]|uniref:Uncharacterized protein n=1 Tax=marine metagenome TaxID=408172 RepID=A0A383A7Y8_9ZZZZ
MGTKDCFSQKFGIFARKNIATARKGKAREPQTKVFLSAAHAALFLQLLPESNFSHYLTKLGSFIR